MKRKALSLLLAMLLAFSAVIPLSGVAFAASEVAVAVYASGVAHYKQENFGKLPAGITAKVDSGNKTVYLYLNNYNGNSIFVITPTKKWTVFASMTGSNSLTINKCPDTGKYHALGTNASMFIYPGGSSASLTINGNFSGTYPDADYYALYGEEIAVGTITADRLSLSINFNLVTSQYANKTVYPVNKNLTINNASVSYSYVSNQQYPNEEAKILLTGGAYFYVYYNAKGAKDRSARAFWGLEYAKEFTGVVYMQIVNGYHYGGAYSYEKFLCEKDPVYRTYIGDTEYYHVRAKNCTFSQNPIDSAVFGKALAFPVAEGYTFPDRVSGTGFDASVVWKDENDNDVTGKTAAAGGTYSAVVTPVPWGTVRIPPLTFENLSPLLQPKPDNRYSYGVSYSGNTLLENGILVRYYVPVPDTVITKQPVNFDGSATNKNARFEVVTTGPVSAYQWQMSDDGKTGWTDVADRTVMSSTPITGAKTRALNYNFVYEPSVTLRFFRCVITGKKNGADTTLYSNVVKYENANRINVVKVNQDALPVHKQPTPTTATVATGHVKVTKYACTMFKKLLDSFEAGDNAEISLELEATDGYVFADELNGVLDGAEFYSCKVSSDKKTAVIQFSYRVGAPEGGIPYESIKYYMDAPVTGEHPADVIYTYDPSGSSSSGGGKQKFIKEAPPVVSVTWYPEDDPFAGHKEYNVQFVVKSVDYDNEGYTGFPYCFNKDTVAYVNNEKAAIQPSADGKTATITYRFPLTADAIPVSSIEFIKLDYPDGETPLDPAADSSTEGVTVDLVTYSKDGKNVTEAAPGDELKVVFNITLADGYVLADDATATWNDLECYAEYTGGTQKFLPVGAHSYLVAFKYTIPEAAPDVMLGDVDHNGKIESADARLALRASVGLESYAPGDKQFIAADVNRDNEIKSEDARLILRASVKLEDPTTW